MVLKNFFLRLFTNYLIKKKKCIRIDSFFVIGFWPMRGIDDFWFYHFLKHNNIWPEKSNLILFSVFYKNVELVKLIPGKKIFFSGENTDIDSSVMIRKQEYFNDCLDFTDLSIGFKQNINSDLYLRIPIWHINYIEPIWDKQEIENWIEGIENNKVINNFINREFSALIASHDISGIREKMLQQISLFGNIECAGKFNNNTSRLQNEFNNNKIQYLRNFKFNICPENSNSKGYVTEKIFDSFLAGCIPIYWGSEGDVESEILNQNRILKFDTLNFELQINRLLQDDNYLIEFYLQPIFTPKAAEVIFQRQNQLLQKFKEIIN